MSKNKKEEQEFTNRLMSLSREAALELIQNEKGLDREKAEEYYNTKKRRNDSTIMLTGAVLILVGALLIGGTVYNRVRNSQINRGYESTGIVTRVRTVNTGKFSTRRILGYRHTFTYEQNGLEYSSRSRAEAAEMYSAGETIPILISSRQPGWAEVLDTRIGRVYVSASNSLWGLLLIAAGSAAVILVRRQKKRV